jgi:hypothetical protein
MVESVQSRDARISELERQAARDLEREAARAVDLEREAVLAVELQRELAGGSRLPLTLPLVVRCCVCVLWFVVAVDA